MQDHPRAPGSARQGTLGTDGPAACGGAAAFSPAPGPSRPRAASLPLPLASDHDRSGAASLPLPNLPSHGLRDPAWAGPRVPLSTLLWPAGVRRLRSVVLHRVIATPGTHLSHLSTTRFAPTRPVSPHLVPTTAGTGDPRHHHSRAPPSATHRKPTLVSPMVLPLRRGDGRNMLRPYGLACTYPSQRARTGANTLPHQARNPHQWPCRACEAPAALPGRENRGEALVHAGEEGGYLIAQDQQQDDHGDGTEADDERVLDDALAMLRPRRAS